MASGRRSPRRRPRAGDRVPARPSSPSGASRARGRVLGRHRCRHLRRGGSRSRVLDRCLRLRKTFTSRLSRTLRSRRLSRRHTRLNPSLRSRRHMWASHRLSSRPRILFERILGDRVPSRKISHRESETLGLYCPATCRHLTLGVLATGPFAATCHLLSRTRASAVPVLTPGDYLKHRRCLCRDLELTIGFWRASRIGMVAVWRFMRASLGNGSLRHRLINAIRLGSFYQVGGDYVAERPMCVFAEEDIPFL